MIVNLWEGRNHAQIQSHVSIKNGWRGYHMATTFDRGGSITLFPLSTKHPAHTKWSRA